MTGLKVQAGYQYPSCMKPCTLASQQPSVSLIKVICYPELTSSACQYECKHEDISRVAYTEACHEKCMVDTMWPYFRSRISIHVPHQMV